MKKLTLRRAFALVLAFAMVFALTACGSTGTSGTASSAAASSGESSAAAPAADDGESVVNIGCTYSVATLNPLMVDTTWSNYYAMTLGFLPLVTLDSNTEWEYMLADEITTDDNIHYMVHINEDAVWSDGEPVTAEDLCYTVAKLASPTIANPNLMLYELVGTDDETGYMTEESNSIEGVTAIDEKTACFTFKSEVTMLAFLNGYAQYILTVPSHILSDMSDSDLVSTTWFNAPTAVSGPYIATAFAGDNYVSYDANPNYWKGTVNIEHANIMIVQSANLYTGMQSGEIDIIPPLLGNIQQEDYEGMMALDNVTADYADAFSVEGVFLNTNVIDNVNVRRAMLLSLDRQTIIDGLLGGAAEIADGFAVPDGPYYSGLTATAYDPDAAAAALETAVSEGWDPNTEYTIYYNSSEATLANALQYAIENNWKPLGLNISIEAKDLDTLMEVIYEDDCAGIAVQYTYTPIDPYWDVQWVLNDWCRVFDDDVMANMDQMLSAEDTETYASALAAIDNYCQTDVPILNLYVNGSLGAVSNRLHNAQASMYGCLNNIQEWTLD